MQKDRTQSVTSAAPTRINITTTPNWHYAAARRAESAARSLSVQASVRGFLGDLAGTRGDHAKVIAARDSYYLLVAAHRAAAHRMERGQRLRYRLSVLTHPAHKVANRVRRILNERRSVSV